MIARVEAPARRMAVLLVLICFVAPPVVLLTKGTTQISGALLLHLGSTVVPMQLGYSLFVSLGAVLLGALLSSGGCACGLFAFPGRAGLEKLMVFPLLLPGWFLAIVHQEGLGSFGPWGLLLSLAVSWAPLFTLFVNAELGRLPRRYPEQLRVLGHHNPLRAVRILFPLTFPAWAAAGALVFLATFGDEASSRTMAVPTLTVGLFDQWFGRQDDAAGAMLALLLLLVSLVPALLLWRLLSRRGDHQDSARLALEQSPRWPLRGWRGAVPWLLSAPELALGVVLPALVVGEWGMDRMERVNLEVIGMDSVRTLLLATGGTAAAAVLALPLVHAAAVSRPSILTAAAGKASIAVFALPVTVLGLSFLWITQTGERQGPAALLSSTPLALLAALGLRYAAVFFVAGRATLDRRAKDHAAVLRTVGLTGIRSVLRCLWPFLKIPAAAAGAYVFLETLKDLSLTLLLQPFGFDTVNTRLFQYAGTGRVKECAVLVFCLALLGVYPLFALMRAVGGKPRGRRKADKGGLRAAS